MGSGLGLATLGCRIATRSETLKVRAGFRRWTLSSRRLSQRNQTGARCFGAMLSGRDLGERRKHHEGLCGRKIVHLRGGENP